MPTTTISGRTRSTGSCKNPVRLCSSSGFPFCLFPHTPLTLVFLLSAAIDAIERPFTPDGAKDLGSVWARQAGGQVLPNARRLAKPNAMMFFHIPL